MIFVAILFVSITAISPDETDEVFDHPVTVASTPELQIVSSRLRAITVLRADFRQEKRIAALRRPLLSEGRFLFATDRGVWWHGTEPFPNTFLITPERIVQKAEGSEPIVIDAEEHPVVDGFSRVFLALFQGDTSALEKRFDLFFTGTADDWTIGLVPKGKIMRRLIDRVILRGETHITEVAFHEKTGDVTRLFFENTTITPATLSDEERAYFAH